MMRVIALDGHHLRVTALGDGDSALGSIAISRVLYTVHLELLAVSLVRATSALGRRADVPELESTGYAVTVDALVHTLRRVNRDRVQGWHPTEAARRVLHDQLLPEVASWLLSPEGVALVREGEAFELVELAAIAKVKAIALRKAADELDGIAERARRGDVAVSERERVRVGYRLITPA